MIKNLILAQLATVLLCSSCSEIKTTDPEKAYYYWAGDSNHERVGLINGSYWQTTHWTKEYILYLEINASQEWKTTFIQDNNLVKTTDGFTLSSDAPNWFDPPSSIDIYKSDDPFDQGSRYFIPSTDARCFIYEIQL